MELMQVNRQWSKRPDDERFTSLFELGAMTSFQRERSTERVVSSRALRAVPDSDNKGIRIAGKKNNSELDITHYAFGQLAARAECPAYFLRKLPAPLACDDLNFGLEFLRDIEDLGMLITAYPDEQITPESKARAQIRAVTGPNYGRIWNSDIVNALIEEYGNGIDGKFRVPGEFGKQVPVTKENTTIFASDRDMHVFLCDEQNKIELPNDRGNEGLSRGFFLWNSEVGDNTFGLASFLFRYVCCNRIIWGATDFNQIKFRHTKSAPDKWLHQVAPILSEYSKGSAKGITETIAAAKASKLDKDLDQFLSGRFGLNNKQIGGIQLAHETEEFRPIETLWDVTQGITAFAKTIPFQNERVAMERIGGKVLDLVAVKSDRNSALNSLSDF